MFVNCDQEEQSLEIFSFQRVLFLEGNSPVLISVVEQYQEEWNENSGGGEKVARKKTAMVLAPTKSNQHLISPYNITAE